MHKVITEGLCFLLLITQGATFWMWEESECTAAEADRISRIYWDNKTRPCDYHSCTEDVQFDYKAIIRESFILGDFENLTKNSFGHGSNRVAVILLVDVNRTNGDSFSQELSALLNSNPDSIVIVYLDQSGSTQESTLQIIHQIISKCSHFLTSNSLFVITRSPYLEAVLGPNLSSADLIAIFGGIQAYNATFRLYLILEITMDKLPKFGSNTAVKNAVIISERISANKDSSQWCLTKLAPFPKFYAVRPKTEGFQKLMWNFWRFPFRNREKSSLETLKNLAVVMCHIQRDPKNILHHN